MKHTYIKHGVLRRLPLLIGYILLNAGFTQAKCYQEAASCDTIENFESYQGNQPGSWTGINHSGIRTVKRNGSTALNAVDGSGASWLYNNQIFPKNLVADRRCEFRYDVEYIAGSSNSLTTSRSITIYNGPDPANSSFKASFVLNTANQVVSGSGPHTIVVPLELADETTLTLPSNSFGSWYISPGGTYTLTQIQAFNSCIQNTTGLAFFLDEGANPAEQWWFDNFTICTCEAPCSASTCCQTNLDIYNAAGTPNPLPPTQTVVNGTVVSRAQETYVVHKDAVMPITEMRVVVTDIQFVTNYEGCVQCMNQPLQWGTLMGGNKVIGEKGLYLQESVPNTGNSGQSDGNFREVAWSSSRGAMLQSGDQVEVRYILPPASDIPCCATSVKICSKIVWKDANCNMCEVPTCSVIDLSTKDVGESCDCKDGTKFVFVRGLNNSTPTGSRIINCGSTISGKMKGGSLTFTGPVVSCSPANCSAHYKWEILKDGKVQQSGTGRNFSYDFKGLSRRSEKYTIRFSPDCGGKNCSACEINLNLSR
ncbi:MAG: hypothetical protein KDC76_09420 [Bacteroidetes bacterium]|nr:hypothetical protein [Bacteroidota bacterium]